MRGAWWVPSTLSQEEGEEDPGWRSSPKCLRGLAPWVCPPGLPPGASWASRGGTRLALRAPGEPVVQASLPGVLWMSGDTGCTRRWGLFTRSQSCRGAGGTWLTCATKQLLGLSPAGCKKGRKESSRQGSQSLRSRGKRTKRGTGVGWTTAGSSLRRKIWSEEAVAASWGSLTRRENS